jgi:3-deoxy-D-manno-octulosonate 8-phosphate phosphatase (KDO 8-P phosphatase)
MIDKEIIQQAAAVHLAVFDVDGVMTGGELILGPDGAEYKSFHVHDGLGLVMLRNAGIEIAVISSRNSRVVSERMAALGIKHVIQGQQDKASALLSLIELLETEPESIAFVGDDLVDLPAMRIAGLAIAVANARETVREQADWITTARGGEGAVREVCELILDAKGLLEQTLQQYLTGI